MLCGSLVILATRTYDLESVGDDADSHELLAVVAAVHHERVGEALNDGALGLAEALDGIAAGRVGDVDGLADLDVVAVGSMSAIVRSYRRTPCPSRSCMCVYSGIPHHRQYCHLPHSTCCVVETMTGRTHVREMSLISTSS